jgi:histidyl-tRNA synthetase
MMKPSLPKGTRDFLPGELVRRNYIFKTIASIFERFGYQGIETPAMENLTSLLGKYGDEGDKLLFKVLNNGDFLSKADESALQNRDSDKLANSISKRGLRYDLTVPFARFVVMHQNELQLPFKRYQIQPVWRADRPQKGRYQEFYQCDADVLGSPALSYEAELVQIYDQVFHELNLPVKIRINNRKILSGLAEILNKEDQFIPMTVAIDKLDKIGWDGVEGELLNSGFTKAESGRLRELLESKDLEPLAMALADSKTGALGIKEISTVKAYLNGYDFHQAFEFDITLARGLSYYTGCIFEVVATEMEYGSLGGGGRYDDLTGIFGMKGNSGVGISFGADRIYDVMLQLDKFPSSLDQSIQVLFIALDEDSHQYAFKALSAVRAAGISADLYPEPAKMKKQMKYADARNVPFVAITGESERQSDTFAVKNMESGAQENLNLDALIKKLS